MHQLTDSRNKVGTVIQDNEIGGETRACGVTPIARYSALKPSLRMWLTVLLAAVGALLLPVTAASQSNAALQCFYDELGQLVTVVYPNGDVVRYTYDAVGDILSITRTQLPSPSALAVFNLLPVRGLPGTAVTIQGQGFDSTPGNNTVQFNGTAAAVTSATATTLSVTVPQGATSGPVSVAVGGATAQGPSFTVNHLTSLSVAPPTVSSALGNTFQFAASGVFDDGSTGDATGLVTWSSSNSTVASISNVAGSQGLATGQSLGTTTITATSGSLTATALLKVAPSGIVSLTVTPATTSVRQGQTTPFSAVAGFLTGPTQDVTGSTFWTSSNSNVATISNTPATSGVATGVAPGTVSITATATGLSGSAQLVVLPPTTSGAVPRFAYQANTDGTVSIFTVDPVTGHLFGRGYAAVPLAALPNSVAIALDPQNRFVFYAVVNPPNPTSSTSVFTLLEDPASGALMLQPGPVTSPGSVWAVVEDPSGHFLYVGGFAGPTGGTAVISAYSINSTTGALTPVAGSPFSIGGSGQTPRMAVEPSGKFLYADGLAAVFAFAIDPITGVLSPVAGSPFAADSPQAITVDAKGKFVYAANTNSSTISAFAINSTSGALTPVPGSPFATGVAAVSISINPSSTFAYVATAQTSPFPIFAYAIDPTTGALTPLAGSPFNTGNLRPSSVSVDPSGAFLYQATGGGGPIEAFTIAPSTGSLTPSGSTFVRTTEGDSVQLALSGGTAPVTFAPQFVFVANSGSNNVSAYIINPTSGALAAVSGSPFATGTSPMSVSTDLAGRFTYIANSGSNNVSAFSVNRTTGVLSTVAGSPFTAGTGPQTVMVEPSSEFVYAGNSGSQNISEYTLNSSTGALSVISGSPISTSFSMTDVISDPTGQLIFAAGNQGNFGMLNIYSVTLNQTSPPAPNGSLQFPIQASAAGLGLKSSSVAVHPFTNFAYVANMGSDNLTGFSFVANGVIPMPESPFATGTMPTSVVIDPSGRFVYVANSGSNNVSGFSIDSTTGAATPLAGSPFSAGTNPSAITVDGSGKFLLVTNKGDNTVSVFAIDANTGAVTAVAGSPFATGTAPVAITVINKLQ
jgi:YD repeat-containing protein